MMKSPRPRERPRRPVPASWRDTDGVITALAPMVGQSDLPFRTLCRRHGCSLAYTEMLMAERFATDADYRVRALGDGVRAFDHPLVVQFAANDPRHFVEAALRAQDLGADAVDLNLGCPQTRAREKHFGAYLTDPVDWELCCSIIREAVDCTELRIPVTVKIRLQQRKDDTPRFATMLAEAGASLVAVHGRHRGSEERRRDGSADLFAVAEVVETLRPLGVPVLSNGNVRGAADLRENLKATGAAGLMVAEHLLKDPAIFAQAGFRTQNDFAVASLPRNCVALAEEYTDLVLRLASGGRGAEYNLEAADRPLRLEDGHMSTRNGLKTAAPASEGEEFERQSVWWANVEVVKSHLTSQLGGRGAELVSRSTFKKAQTVAAAIHCFRKRFRLPAMPQLPLCSAPCGEDSGDGT